MKIAIVAPCHIPPTLDWITSLQREAKVGGADVIIVDDSDGQLGPLPEAWRILDYAKQKEVLGENYEEFAKLFHKSSACRIVGHVLAFRENYDAVIGLDSDCVVPFNFVRAHVSGLNAPFAYGWSNPLGGSGWYPRGFPYSMRNWRAVANMGMWNNVLDLNGKDRSPMEPRDVNAPGSLVATGAIPFSGMNFALTRTAIPGFLFLPNFNFNDDQFRRIDDIWGGYIFQKLAHERHEATIYGGPIVFHDTVVIPEEDAAEEAAMYKHEDAFLKLVDKSMAEAEFEGAKDYIDLFSLFLLEFMAEQQDKYPQFAEVIPAMRLWIKIFKK